LTIELNQFNELLVELINFRLSWNRAFSSTHTNVKWEIPLYKAGKPRVILRKP